MISDWRQMKAFALSLGSPKVEQAKSWYNGVLKAHGKLWGWWSPYVDSALFKYAKDEREMLRTADPDTFIHHKHYEAQNLILVAAGRIDEGWVEARLRPTWHAAALKLFLKDWDATKG